MLCGGPHLVQEASPHPPLWVGRPTATLLLEPLPLPPGVDWDRPFAGLHDAALTALGPTGTHAEHITDMLSAPRRVHANKIHAAPSAPPAGSPQVRFRQPLGGLRARGSAGSARKMASRDPSRWVSSCAQPRPS